MTGVLASLYSTEDWPQLAQALQQAISGDGSDLDAIALSYEGFQPNGSLENIEESNTAVNCLDHPVPTTVSRICGVRSAVRSAGARLRCPEAWGSLICAFWPVPPTGSPAPLHAPGAPPILVVGTTHDPATPYEWAQALASQLDSGVLLTRDGDGHTAYFSSTCVQNWADSYLTTLAMPPQGDRLPKQLIRAKGAPTRPTQTFRITNSIGIWHKPESSTFIDGLTTLHQTGASGPKLCSVAAICRPMPSFTMNNRSILENCVAATAGVSRTRASEVASTRWCRPCRRVVMGGS